MFLIVSVYIYKLSVIAFYYLALMIAISAYMNVYSLSYCPKQPGCKFAFPIQVALLISFSRRNSVIDVGDVPSHVISIL